MQSFEKTFGRWYADRKEAGFNVWIEVCGDDEREDGWLPLVGPNGACIGHVHFMSLGRGFYEVDQLRPASCPMQGPVVDCEQPLCLRKEEI